jgi:hypothetical protein
MNPYPHERHLMTTHHNPRPNQHEKQRSHGAGDVLTTHHLEFDVVEASQTIDRLRASLPRYAAEMGLISASLYCTQNSSEVLLIGHWHDFADVTRSLESIYARPALFSSVDSAEFRVYALVEEVNSEAADAGRTRGSSRSNR